MHRTVLAAAMTSIATAAMSVVLVAAPAYADTPTTIVLTLGGGTHVKGLYGNDIGDFDGDVTYINANGDPDQVINGSSVLQRKLPGGGWTDVKTDTDSGFLYYGSYGSHAHGNMKYRVHYLGGTGQDVDGTTVTWAPSYSNVVTVGTYWNMHDAGSCSGGCHLKGHLSPTAKHHRILVQVKHHGWHKYKVIHTNHKSHYRVGIAPSGGGTKYRMIVRGTTNLLKTKSHVWIAYHN